MIFDLYYMFSCSIASIDVLGSPSHLAGSELIIPSFQASVSVITKILTVILTKGSLLQQSIFY